MTDKEIELICRLTVHRAVLAHLINQMNALESLSSMMAGLDQAEAPGAAMRAAAICRDEVDEITLAVKRLK